MTKDEKIKLEKIRKRLSVINNAEPGFYITMAKISRKLTELINGGVSDDEKRKNQTRRHKTTSSCSK